MKTLPSQPIPKHHNRDYAKRLRDWSPFYFCWDGTWKEVKNPDVPSAAPRLVEVWDSGGGIIVHPSRHPYCRVEDPEQKRI